jgi:hypothetical protein
MFAALGLSMVLIAAQVQVPCYELYDAEGTSIYRDREPPFSRELPPTAEAAASRARGERLVVYSDTECGGRTVTSPQGEEPVRLAAGDTRSDAPPQFAPIEARVGGSRLAIAPARPDGDPEARVAYDPFAEGRVRGGFLAGIERIRRGTAADHEPGLSFLDTATLAETEGKAAMHRAAMEIARWGGERAYDSVYNCYLGNDPGNCITENRLAGLIDRAMNPGTTAYDRERAAMARAALNSWGFAKLAEGDAYMSAEAIRTRAALPSAGSRIDQMLARLLRRVIDGDKEAMRTWLALHGGLEGRTGEGREEAKPPPAVALPSPRLSFEEAEKLATEEERQRKNWWIFQLPLDRRQITERTLEILEQSALAPNPYKTRDEVFEAWRAGRITREEALRYLGSMPGG